MKEFTLSENQSGYQLRQVLHKILSEAPSSFIYKMLRKKNITLNGKKADGTEVTQPGDIINIWLSDETYEKFAKAGYGTNANEKDGSNSKFETSKNATKDGASSTKVATSSDANPTKKSAKIPSLTVIYQDEDVLLFVKPQGLLSQKSDMSDVSANDFVLQYAKEHGLWPENDPIFKPSIVNRLDRNTEGIMVAGVSAKGLRILNEMFKDRTVAKYYRAIVVGKAPKSKHLSGYLLKNEAKNTVKILADAQKGAEKIETAFECLEYDGEKNLSLLKVHLITGKSHQIRAHLNSIGLPILGDTKYGKRDMNEAFHCKMQCLQSYQLTVPKCELEGVSEKTFEIPIPEHWPKLGES